MSAFSTDAVANRFIAKAMLCHAAFSPMKLQKLLYYAHGWHLALSRSGTALVSEQPQAWEYGPVFPSIYHEFKDLGGRPIARMAVDARMESGNVSVYTPDMDTEARMLALDLPFADAVINRVWEVYGPYGATTLSEMTHEEGSPWWMVREQAKAKFGGMVPKGISIPNEAIRSWFKTRFQVQAASTATA